MEAISIVGGGIAGLALAACLDPSRYEVSIFEKRPELPAVGTVLAMWPNAQRALARVGVLARARAVSPVLGNGSIRNAAGKPWVTVRGGELFGISRVDLLRLLDGAVPGTVRRVAAHVRQLPPGDGLLVGADGVHSVVRREVWGTATDARLTSAIAVRGTIPSPVETGAVGEYWGRGDLFGIAAAPGGTNWYGSWRSTLGPTGIDVEEALTQARRRFAGHAPAIRQVLATARPELSLAQRIWTVPPLRSYVRAAAVLVGDAAHAMTPNLGRGACESLVDAVVLADLLNSLPRDKALADYDRQRRLRTRALSVGSAAMMRVSLAERGQPLRDGLLNLAASLSPAAAYPSGGGWGSGPGRK
ncbi:FAD-dependent monooxygenase [Pseudarthrobacter sp. NPDC058196]|uniref:FAD-dependent monooxygenase n=1 Tax=Pseudarthrobacter sp. NPDC058196 TaxID=3346376 RepID=UPI0036D86192